MRQVHIDCRASAPSSYFCPARCSEYARPVAIGAEINGENVRDTVGELNAYFDELRIYDRALRADEVRALSETPSGPLR